jgi:hypothetical protein
MLKDSIGKNSLCFRINADLLNKFQKIVLNQHGYGEQSKIIEHLIQQYVNKFDDTIELNDPIRTAPSIMSDLKNEIIPFLKKLDLEIITSPNNKQGMLQGPLELALNNCRESSIYARALRVRRVMGTTSFESQKITPMTYEEAYEMIKINRMETHMNQRLKELHFEVIRKGNNNEE